MIKNYFNADTRYATFPYSLHKRGNFTSQEVGKEEQVKPKVSRRKEIINIRAEINQTENRKNNRKINES